MPDKRRELWYAEQLRLAVSDFPAGVMDSDESPDVIVISDARRVGIEITAFHMPPPPGERPQRERQSLKRRVVEQAFQLHTQAGGPALYVRVHFGDVSALRKSDVREIAKALADAVLWTEVPTSMDEGWILVPFRQLPRPVVSIRIAATVDRMDRLWTADAGGWVAPVLPHHIEAVIAAKLPMFEKARVKCDELWLVIVNDAFIDAPPVELSESAASQVYEHPFARLLWLEPHRPHVVSLASSGGRNGSHKNPVDTERN